MRTKHKTRLVVLVVAIAGLAMPTAASAAWGPKKYMAQAIGEILVMGRKLSDETSLGYDEGSVCLVGVLLEKGNTYSMTRRFQAGMEYFFLAGGDEDVRDLDIAILDGNGNSVVQDRKSERMAWVRFSPSYSGEYRVQMRLYDAHRASFCTFAIMRSGGYDVPVQNLVAAGDKYLNMCERVSLLADKADLKTSFLARPNQAAVWGAILNSGESSTVSNLDLGGQTIVAVSAGDTQAGDVDLGLANANGIRLASDTQPDANPVVTHQASRGSRYKLTAKNVTANGRASLVLFGVLQITQ